MIRSIPSSTESAFLSGIIDGLCCLRNVGQYRADGVAPNSDHPFTMSSNANHCSFVLLAEFHIFEGAQLKYQFPQPLGVDEG